MIKFKEYNTYIIMYHYVRELKKGKSLNLNALDYKKFQEQIKFFKKNCNIISSEEFIEICKNKKFLKKPSIILTFDDGYKDHYKFVFPFLRKNKVSGTFYIPVNNIEKKTVLDVNKIQFVLAKENNKKKLLEKIFYYIRKYFHLKPDQLNLKSINLYDRYNNQDTMLIKNMLQYHLSKNIRKKVINSIFKDIVNLDEKEFSEDLYMSVENLKEMHKENMFFGSHGFDHECLEHLSFNRQDYDISNSISFLKRKKLIKNCMSICYPFGSYNKDTIKLSKQYNFDFGICGDVGSVFKNRFKNKYLLPRYDTTDFL